jgi:hypothetical protein
MDPDELLRQIRDRVAEVRSYLSGEPEDDLIGDLIDKVTDLDDWLSRGGFLPMPWHAAHVRSSGNS